MNKMLPLALALLCWNAIGCESSSSDGGSTVASDAAAVSDSVDVSDAVVVSDITGGSDTDAADTTTPLTPAPLSVASTVPTSGAVASPVDPLVVTFNQPVDSASLSDLTVTLSGPDGQVSGTHAVDGAVYTFTPSSPLLGDTPYTLALTTGVTAAGGDAALTAPLTLAFSTVAGMSVISVEPLDGAEKVATSTAVRIAFDRPVTAQTVNADTVQIVTSGWVDGVEYDNQPLPGKYRVIDENGVTADEGVMVEWFVDTQALPEYEVRHDVIVTRGVRAVDGAVLDANFESSFWTQLLSSDFYYTLHVDGFGADLSLGLDGSGNLAEMTDLTVADGFQWYVVYLNDNKSVGIWNLAADGALRENGASGAATLESWQGIVEQAFQIEKYGGTAGATAPNCYRPHFLMAPPPFSVRLSDGTHVQSHLRREVAAPWIAM